jgi:outer membrane protein, multidrug efflux system
MALPLKDLSCWIAGAAVLMAGCAPLARPEPERPLPVATHYDETSDGRQATLLAWRDYMTDPQLQTLIELALANNRDLRLAALRIEEARAAYGIQRTEQWPTLAAQADLSRTRTPADLNLTGRPLLGSQYQIGLGMASWEIDFWGRVRSLKDAALQNYLATEAAHHAATLALIGQVANSYLQLCELDERLALARRTTASRAESLRIFTRRVEVGATSRLNLTQVQTLYTQAQALGAQLEQARAAQAQALTLLVGATLALPARSLDLSAGFTPLASGLPAELLLARPDIAAAEHQLKAAQANIGAARAAFFPRIALTGSLGTASAELGGLFDSGSQAWTFTPSISLPLFDGGRRQLNLNLSEARREAAVASYEKTVQAAFRDVNDALSASRWLSEQLDIADTALAAQRERARLSQLRFDNGAAAFLDVLDAQRELLAAEQQQVQIRRALLSSQIGLYTALGGGSLTRATP